MPELEIHYAEEWAALYVDGRLEVVGDSYLAEEQALELCGVTVVQDDSFMQGQQYREGVAQTLNDVIAYKSQREIMNARVQELRHQANTLLHEANLLESK